MKSHVGQSLKVACALLPLLYAAYLIVNHICFERFLNTLYITFDDFDPIYAKTLIDVEPGQEPTFDNFPTLESLNGSSTIPGKIHFIWFRDLYSAHLDISEMPHCGSRSPGDCQRHNPHFDVRVWNATEARAFLAEHYEWFIPTYDGYKHPIQRVDAFKYFVLWHYGGIYMDLDVNCRRSLMPLLEFPAWFPEASPLGVNNDLMASRARHPVIGKMTRTLKARDWNLFFPYLTIFWSTGPQFTSDALYRWWNKYTGKPYERGASKRDRDPDAFYILPQDFYSERHTFFGHSPGGTWHGSDVAVILWLVGRPWIPVLGVAVLTLLYFMARSRWRKHEGYRYKRLAVKTIEDC